MDCIFCKILNGEIPSYKVYEDEYVYAFLDITQGTKEHWAHPVIHDGRLLLRHGNVLMAFKIK